MGSLAEMLGDKADKLVRAALNVGDVHILPLGKENNITPKDGQQTKDKFFVIPGFDTQGNIIGGVVINSKINYNLPDTITDYYMPIKMSECPFLRYNSFADCSKLIVARRDKFGATTYRGEMPSERVDEIKQTLIGNPSIDKELLNTYGIV